MKPIEKYVLTFAKDENGNDLKYRFMLTLSRGLKDNINGGPKPVGQNLMDNLTKLDGIDNAAICGRYTLEIVIARTFDPDEVITELKRVLDEEVLSEIIRPTII